MAANYRMPDQSDLDRQLGDILHRAHKGATEKLPYTASDFAKAGRVGSSAHVSAAARHLCDAHTQAIIESMRLLVAFAARTEMTVADLASKARIHLATFGQTLIASIPVTGHPSETANTRECYEAIFGQHLDGAIRDFEIGFIGGENVVPLRDTGLRASVLRKLYIERHEKSFVDLRELADAAGLGQEMQTAMNICEQLADARLIEWKTPGGGAPVGMGRITHRGVDVMEGTASAPIAISIDRSVTITNSSHIQAGDFGDHASIAGNATITVNDFAARVADLADQLERHRSALPESIRDGVASAIDELRGAAAAPDAGRLRRALGSLKAIMETATGDLIAGGTLLAIQHLLQAAPLGH
jgi:hypothetical protein